MKYKSKTGNFTDREWEEMALSLSEETQNKLELPGGLLGEDAHIIEDQWKELSKMSEDKDINVDKAWDKLHSRLNEAGSFQQKILREPVFMRSTFLRIAAVALILLSIGSVIIYLAGTDTFSRNIVASTGNIQKNQIVTLPDGSNISLNRNTQLSYRSNFGKRGRNVTLKGEAFFEITPDASKPFIIDAGNANVKVFGTSFNVITQNTDSAVEVFVKTGKVMLSNNSGTRKLVLEPGYVGTMDSKHSGKTLNSNPNYLSWNTNLLVYDGQTLDVVFKDLKKVYDMDIVADDPGITDETWTTQIDNQTQDTIIRLICASFNLSYIKDGSVFHLSKK